MTEKNLSLDPSTIAPNSIISRTTYDDWGQATVLELAEDWVIYARDDDGGQFADIYSKKQYGSKADLDQALVFFTYDRVNAWKKRNGIV